jgi:hypothetical protein
MNTLFGMNVMTSALVKPVPVLQISPAFKDCSDECREEMNRYLLEMFGTKDVAYMIGKDTLVLNSKMLEDLKRTIPKHWAAPDLLGLGRGFNS